MSVIKKTVAETIFDDIAAKQNILEASYTSGLGGLVYTYAIHSGVGMDGQTQYLAEDALVETQLLPSAYDVDTNWSSGIALNNIYGNFIQAFTNHFIAHGYDNFDDYLTDQGLNVHEKFNPVYESTFNSSLLAINVFRVTQITMGTLDVTAGPAYVFTDGDALGTGSGTFDGDTNSAAAQIEAYVAAKAGATDLDITVTGTSEQGSTITDSATIPGASIVGDIITLGFHRFLDITNIEQDGAGAGDDGDQILIRNRIERSLPTITL